MREIKRGERGRVSSLPSVASIRESTGLSQSRFAELLGVSARTLLLIAAINPRALRQVA